MPEAVVGGVVDGDGSSRRQCRQYSFAIIFPQEAWITVGNNVVLCRALSLEA